MVSATSFFEGTNSTLVVRVDKEPNVMKFSCLQEVHQQFNCDCLQPANIPASNFPGHGQLESGPLVSQDNTNTPGGGSINEDMQILGNATGAKVAIDVRD